MIRSLILLGVGIALLLVGGSIFFSLQPAIFNDYSSEGVTRPIIAIFLLMAALPTIGVALNSIITSDTANRD